MDYWTDCIKEAFEDSGIEATKEQVNNVAGWAESSHENYGMAHGHDCIPNPMSSEVEELKRERVAIQERHERQLNGIRKGVASRRNVDVGSINIDDSGKVTYAN